MNFEKLYKNVPFNQKEKLKSFRLNHRAKRINTGEKQWSYISCGTGEKAILFLPGAFLKADMWFYSITELEKEFRIIAPDSNTLSGISAGQALKTIPEIMDAEGIKKANLIGLSAGGGLAQILVSEYPDRVEDMVLSHTGIIEYDSGMEKKTRRLIRLVKIMPLSIIRKSILKMTGSNISVTGQWSDFHNAYFKEGLSGVTRQAVLNFLENGIILRREFESKIDVPKSWKGRILILNSKDDDVTLSRLEKLKQRYPGSVTHIFEKGGHHTFMLYPEIYTSIIRDFLINQG
jgi:aminoacrylate hydrolase